jgi:hypothetical protein
MVSYREFLIHPKGITMISHSTRVLARQALTAQLKRLEADIIYDKAMITVNYEDADVLLPYETAEAFQHLNFWKNELRKETNKAQRIRKALKELK